MFYYNLANSKVEELIHISTVLQTCNQFKLQYETKFSNI